MTNLCARMVLIKKTLTIRVVKEEEKAKLRRVY